MDDCSRFTWAFLMKRKSDVHQIIPYFIAMIENQLSKKSKTFRFDNAKELVFGEFFSKKGILHHFSCIETPQQNSVVERKH